MWKLCGYVDGLVNFLVNILHTYTLFLLQVAQKHYKKKFIIIPYII
jgi:hypothetical protein